MHLTRGLIKPEGSMPVDEPKSLPWAGVFYPWEKGAPHCCGDDDVSSLYEGSKFPGCNNAPVHLVTLDLAQLPNLGPGVVGLGKLPLVYTNCESCDAWMLEGEDVDGEIYFHLTQSHRLAPIGPERYANCCQPGSVTFPPKEKKAIRFQPHNPDDRYPAVMVGGEPRWMQGDDWLFCPGCETDMSFVAHVRAAWLKAVSYGDQDLYAFACPTCRIVGMKMQFT